MIPLNELTSESILEDKIFIEIFEQEDPIYHARLLLSLEDRAAQLGVKTKFTKLLNAYKKANREMQRDKNNVSLLDRWTNFHGPYDNMQCGSWIASEEGIYMQNQGTTDIQACYHPILPIERLKNLETGEEQLKIAYKRNKRWDEIIVPKDLVASANKIVALSKKGIAVTSENAKYLVRYMADVENFNDEDIKVQYSSSKLGWIKDKFIPYDTDIVFDGDARFKQVFESISERGSRNKWIDHVNKLRSTNRIEIKFILASSFASILVSLLGGLPFIVDLWGETEGGKSVTLMLACSVWANPDENRYIGDFKTTDVALEARSDLLNNLPMLLDDTSKTSAKIRENFEGIVYDLCSGKGKSRSNKDLGMNRENRWKNAILTNGERPLNSYVIQGGAINRILEIECREKTYEDPHQTAELLKQNYGFAGKEFVQIVKDMGIDEIKKIQKDIMKQIQDDEKMQKQSISLSIVLAADKIATERLFKDGEYIQIEDAKQVLIDRNELSDNERCYQYLLNEIVVNSVKFDPNINTMEKWGVMENGYAIINNNIFDNMCIKGGFSKKSFLSWAKKKSLILADNNRLNKTKKINGYVNRYIFLKLDDGIIIDDAGFMHLTDGQEEIPFS